MNLVPSNAYQYPIRGDCDALPIITQWSGLHIEDDEVVLLSQEDMVSAFYLFGMPRTWWRFFAFDLIVDGSFFSGGLPGKRYALCSQVLPQGWVSSVGVMQHLHRRIMAAPPPRWSRPARIRRAY